MELWYLGSITDPEEKLRRAINNTIMQQAEIEALKAQVVLAEKKAYWQGFETGSIYRWEKILPHYNDWLDLKKVNQQGDKNGK